MASTPEDFAPPFSPSGLDMTLTGLNRALPGEGSQSPPSSGSGGSSSYTSGSATTSTSTSTSNANSNSSLGSSSSVHAHNTANANANANAVNVNAGGEGRMRFGSMTISRRDAANSASGSGSGGGCSSNAMSSYATGPTTGVGGAGTGTGTKTPRKNVQWAASTKGEGPMNAAAEQMHQMQQERGRGRERERFQESERNMHVHLLDEEGLDPEAFQTLTHALERHQSSSREDLHSSVTGPHALPTVRRDFAAGTSEGGGGGSGPYPNIQIGRRTGMNLMRRSDPPRLAWLPPNPFSPPNSNHNANGGTHGHGHAGNSIGGFSEIFTPTTLSPIHSDAGTETEEYFTAERSVPGEAIIESTETAGLPHALPANAGDSGARNGEASDRHGGRRIGEGALGAIDAEELERKRAERRATRLVKAHARGFQFMAGFKGNKAMQRLAPEDIDPEAPLPRRATRFSRRPKSAPPPAAEKHASPERMSRRERAFGRWRWSRGREREGRIQEGEEDEEKEKRKKKLDEDVEDSAAQRYTHHAPLALGSGVLGALLTLYDRGPQAGMRSGFSTPGDQTPIGSEPVTPEAHEYHERHGSFGKRKDRDREKDEKGDYFGKHAQSGRDRDRESKSRKQMQELERINTRMNAGSMLEGEQELDGDKEREQEAEKETGSEELTPPHPLYAQRSATLSLQSLKLKEPLYELKRTMSGGLERIKDKASPSKLAALPMPRVLGLGGDNLPSGARNAGGVFGSLIASTGNLTGIAAPEPSRIAPNPKRPGYHLSRYSWGEETQQTKKWTRRSGPMRGTPGHSPSSSVGGHGSESPWGGIGMSKSAPVTPAGEVPPTITIAGTSPSPGSEASMGSDTPLMGALPSKATLDSSSTATLAGPGHTSSKSLDSGISAHSRSYSDTLTLAPVATRDSATSTTSRRKWTGILKDFPKTGSGWTTSETRSGAATPDTTSETGSGDHWDEKHRRWVNASTSAEERRKRKRKKAEIFITRHVAEIMQRQEFILKLARAFMMFGAPSHRLPAQIQATARVLDMELSCMYLPDMMLISFDDAATSTSNIKFIRQGAALNLGKLQEAYDLYWKVIHDEVGVGEASRKLDELMQQRPPYSTWQLALFGGFCSASICQVSFAGSLIDTLIAFPLGMLLVFVQILSVRNELYSNVFEITIATLLSFLAAVFAGTHHFCYSAVASGSIVLILPGFLVLNGSLELSSRNIVSGAVRLCYAIMYALFLGFGLSIGGTLYEKFTGTPVADPEDYTCASSHKTNGPWYQRSPSGYWAFLTVPMFSLFLSLRNQAPWWKKELLVTVLISCLGWTCNHFSALKFPGRNDVSSAIGAFAVGFVANLYGRFFSGNAFVIMITGILFQLPSGLGNGGLITFASQNNSSGTSTSYLSGFKTASQLISVSVGLTVGLGISLVVIFPIQSRKRAGGIFSL